MKAILTFSLVLFFGGMSMAQNVKKNDKVDTLQENVILTDNSLDTENIEILVGEKQTEVARLYRYKNSRVKSALFFKTKKDKPKLA
ncbi:hypothetical protein [Maribacter cobaltidurans]|uniref:Uncharacterized protein n=1 Tax=Maribacter cobaltidurans TaxID=1178778 RepID=A0A223V1Q0_9FLAO|nr:hypothetical protein [Maribacter cobaltidurans]ASV29040.1 hypothetical protein CJ263_01700 [Maribacter cobaltidurans]GGD72424.1 hypothetical protein GCM10011412_07560 [Maribacter cobaltidurans]